MNIFYVNFNLALSASNNFLTLVNVAGAVADVADGNNIVDEDVYGLSIRTWSNTIMELPDHSHGKLPTK